MYIILYVSVTNHAVTMSKADKLCLHLSCEPPHGSYIYAYDNKLYLCISLIKRLSQLNIIICT